MGDKGGKDKGGKEQKKKPKLNLKEKRKAKKEKENNKIHYNHISEVTLFFLVFLSEYHKCIHTLECSLE